MCILYISELHAYVKRFVCLSVCFIPRLDIEECQSCECDYLQVSHDYNSLQSSGQFCGRYSEQYLEHRLNEIGLPLASTVPGTTLYVRFVSDDNVHLKGFNVSIIPGSDGEI